MIKEELQLLFNKDDRAFDENNIDYSLFKKFDEFLVSKIDNSFNQEVFSVYKKFVDMKQEAPDSMKTVLFSTIRNYANDELSKKDYIGALVLFRFLIVKSALDSLDYINIAKCLICASDTALYKDFLQLYENKEENKLLAYIELADIYKTIKDYKSAINCYEKFLSKDPTKISVYTITADLYSKLNGSESLGKQTELYKKAYTIDPNNRLVLHGLAYGYEKLGIKDKAKIFYEKLLENNPTENDYYNYGGFLISCGDFANGHKYFTHRFNIDDINLKYPADEAKKWDFKSDISDKTLLIHYEQGFGDTIMYCRFVPQMKNIAQKVIFVVQKELYNLIAASEIFKDIEIVTDEKSADYDVNMALLDVPLVVNANSDNLPYTTGYLNIPQYKPAEDNNNKFKIGLSLSGSKTANYSGRDIEVERIYKLLKDIPNITLYNLQKDDKECDGIISLGKTFKDFTDSACAVCNMDLIISTDNVILNLSGALGVETIGLFNKETNYRWFKPEGENVGWYESVKPLQNKKQNDWDNTISELENIIQHKLKLN